MSREGNGSVWHCQSLQLEENHWENAEGKCIDPLFKVQDGRPAWNSHCSPCSEETTLDFLALGGGGGGLTSRLLGNGGATWNNTNIHIQSKWQVKSHLCAGLVQELWKNERETSTNSTEYRLDVATV